MSRELAVLRENRNALAVRHGLPPIGAAMTNQHGIHWRVDGHFFAPTLTTLARGPLVAENPRDLFPVLHPQNLSPRLLEFIAETDRCTSKQLLLLDTLPHLRPGEAHPNGYWVDAWSNPAFIPVFLDAAHVHETVIAHEIGHVWVDLVDDCEDYRILRDLSNTAKVFLWTNLQSFVLDNKVNAVLREKGFDMGVIENDVEAALASFAAAILSGYCPPTAYEAVFVASTLAAAMLDYETGALDALQSLDMAAMVFQRDLPDVYNLALHMAASVRRHGYSDRASIRRAIDECALLSFAYVGELFDLERELIEDTQAETCNDKYPQFFPGLPVPAKLEIGKAMAKMKIPAGAECRLNYAADGNVQVQFLEASGEWTQPVMLRQCLHLPHDATFAGRQRSKPRRSISMKQPVQPTPARNISQPGVSAVTMPSKPTLPSVPLPGSSSMRRTYAPGLARFLSQARLQEQLGGEHPYGYALNNPVNYTDPTGMAPPCLPRRPNPYSQDCSSCFDDIKINFGFTYNHYCHHFYAHCTMCCILSRSYGESCANISQHQELIDKGQDNPPIGSPILGFNQGRWHGCNKGKAIARDASKNSMSCANACLQKGSGFPWPTSGPGYPFSPILESCDDYLKHPEPFGDAGPSCPKQ